MLSAVAARRAARLAAQATPQQSATPPRAPSPAPAQDDDSQSDSGASSSSADSDAEVAAQLAQPQQQRKSKGKAPARYFAAQEPDEVVLARASDDAQMYDDGDVSPPEGLDPASDVEPDVLELATPVRARRRREKSAFVDPFCVSAFHFLEGVNAVQTTVIDEGGLEREAAVYALQHGETLVIRGACTLTPVFGAISVLGATLRAVAPAAADESTVVLPSLSASSSHPLFAPSSHPLPPIRGVPLSSPSSQSLLLPSGASLDLTPYDAVVLVSDLSSGIDGIERVLVAGGMGQGAGMFARGKEAGEKARGGRTWSLVLEPEPSLAGLRSNDDWLSALSSAVPPSASDDEDSRASDRLIALVEGPKRAGKSTFAKMLVNALLDRYDAVAYLDTDLGQPEFTPSGLVSLSLLRRPVLGPAFTHLSLPLASRFLGSTSPASDPNAYLAASQALLETYALEVEYPLDAPSSLSGKLAERVPLVINTQGWVKGLGADLLEKLKALSRPTHVFSFATDDAPPPGPPPLGAACTLLPPAPPSPLESKWSAAEYRALSLVSYFHALLPASPSSPPAWDFTAPLLARAPYALTLADLPSGTHLLSPAGGGVPRTHTLHALNGALVALAAAPSPEIAAAGGAAALGLALVHSIAPGPDAGKATLHVHTPVPAATLASARAELALLKGEVDLPVALMLDWAASPSEGEEGVAGIQWREVPFLSVEAGEGGARRHVRRNVMRRGQA
ncbi:Polynucleotide 5'-hydroxyl-kinase grc3 [Rhodotorula kratochvilovae]